GDTAEQSAFEVPHLESDQVRAVVLAITRRRQLLPIDLDPRARQERRGIAALDPLQTDDQPLSLHVPLDQTSSSPLAALWPQRPLAVLEQCVQRLREGGYVHPARQAEGSSDPAELHPAHRRRHSGWPVARRPLLQAVACFR